MIDQACVMSAMPGGRTPRALTVTPLDCAILIRCRRSLHTPDLADRILAHLFADGDPLPPSRSRLRTLIVRWGRRLRSALT